jgi:hypothetical protein
MKCAVMFDVQIELQTYISSDTEELCMIFIDMGIDFSEWSRRRAVHVEFEMAVIYLRD